MPPTVDNEYCCCQVFPIYHGVYLIALHCILQAAYAVGLILTTYHRPKNYGVIFVTVASNICLIPTAILIFWSNLYESWKGARAAGYLVFLMALFNSITAGLYFSWYFHFNANSQLDKDFFWKDTYDWISSEDLPFTVWHFLTFELIPVNLIWYYYSRIMCRLAILLKAKQSQPTQHL